MDITHRHESILRSIPEPLPHPRFAEPGIVHAGAAGGVSHWCAHSHAGHQYRRAGDNLPSSRQVSFLGIFDLFSGGNFRRLTIFALGIMPYITSSIILQLMTVVFPYLESLQKEGELGRRKITQYTRYLTILLSIIQSTTIATALQASNYGGQSLVYHPGPSFILMTILTLTTGSAFIMWLGEQISERGIGNGMSLIIFVGIVVGLPRGIFDLYEKAEHRGLGSVHVAGRDLSGRADDRRGGLHRFRGRRAAPHSGAVCQARGRPQGDGWAVLLSSVARQFRRRDSADFRQLVAGVSGHGRAHVRHALQVRQAISARWSLSVSRSTT